MAEITAGETAGARDETLLGALGASVDRLARMAQGLSADQLREQAYPTEWTIADVLSHLGSGSVIMRRRLEDALADRPYDDGFNTATWDAWNAMPPGDQAADALVCDRALLDALTAVGPEARSRFTLPFGPRMLDFAGMVQLRLNEHVVHSWDIAVTLDPSTRLAGDATGLVLDSLGMLTGFAGRATPDGPTLRVRTTDPGRDLTLALGPERVELTPAIAGVDGAGAADVEMPAEAFVRLVYGRLDPDHTPHGVASPHLDDLRRAFPGF